MSGYLVDANGYRGPLAVLLELVEANNYPVHELPLATITRQYLKAIEAAQPTVGDLADFITLGARLVMLKSRSLLPVATITTDSPNDEVRLLSKQLAGYQLARRQTSSLKLLLTTPGYRRPHRQAPNHADTSNQSELKVSSIAIAYRRLCKRQPRLPSPAHQPLAYRTINHHLTMDLQGGPVTIPFSEHPQNWPDSDMRTLNIMAFASILELSRHGRVIIEQAHRFGPINIRMVS